MIISDNGEMVFNSQCDKLFKSHEILHQSSCPHTPHHNGAVERKHMHILEPSRAIRFGDAYLSSSGESAY